MVSYTPDASALQDRLLVCADCGKDFVFSAGEQKFFQDKRLDAPKRCCPCRKRRKQTLPPITEDGR